MYKRPWISVHVFYHSDMDALISEGVRPLVEELRASGTVQEFFFVRYWQGGPHLRLRMLPSPGSETVVKQRLEAYLSSFLASRPSESSIRSDHYYRTAAALSKLEYGQDHVQPLYPDNSIRYIEYEPEFTRYGGVLPMRAVEGHFTDSSVIVGEVIANDEDQSRRHVLALSMMLTAAALCERDGDSLLRFFEASHAVWARFIGPNRRRYETQLEVRHNHQRGRLRELVCSLLDSAWGGTYSELHPAVSRWTRSVSSLRDCLTLLEQEGSFRPRLPIPMVEAEGKDGLGLKLVILSCCHMNSNRLGVSPHEEAYLALLIKWTLAELAGDGGLRKFAGADREGAIR